MSAQSPASSVETILSSAANNYELAKTRLALATFASDVFRKCAEHTHVAGYILGEDRDGGQSPFGNANDEAVGVSLLLRIASELVVASAELLSSGRVYAGAALLRQLVEVEYLAWAFQTRDEDAQRWLRSQKKDRETFFKPAKLREAAKGKFRGKDYGYHCEFGGHPTPSAFGLFGGDAQIAQLLLSDLLGHTGRIWDHLIGWAADHDPYGARLISNAAEMLTRFQAWKAEDPLTQLPPP